MHPLQAFKKVYKALLKDFLNAVGDILNVHFVQKNKLPLLEA